MCAMLKSNIYKNFFEISNSLLYGRTIVHIKGRARTRPRTRRSGGRYVISWMHPKVSDINVQYEKDENERRLGQFRIMVDGVLLVNFSHLIFEFCPDVIVVRLGASRHRQSIVPTAGKNYSLAWLTTPEKNKEWTKKKGWSIKEE